MSANHQARLEGCLLREGLYTWDDLRRWSMLVFGVDLTESMR